MIHIASVHWKSSAFQNIQFEFVKKNISNSSMWCFLDKIDNANKNNSDMYIFHAESGISNHLVKLDRLASLICSSASDEDVLMFLDGDCWPVCCLDDFVHNSLRSFPLAAAMRRENGERYPHPCFFFTTVKFWKENGLAWGGKTLNGKHLGINYIKNYMDSKNKKWLALRRTGGLSDHKVFFSFYGKRKHMIYHHGAGFRNSSSGFCMRNKIKIGEYEKSEMMKCFLDWNYKQNYL